MQAARQSSTSGGSVATSISVRGVDGTPAGQRSSAASGLQPVGSNSGRITLPLASAISSGGGVAAGTPVTPTPRSGTASAAATGSRTPPPASHGNNHGVHGAARTPPPVPLPTPVTSRLPRSAGGASASPVPSTGGANSAGGAGPAAAAQLQKYDGAIQSLKEGLRAATVGAVAVTGRRERLVPGPHRQIIG